MRAVPLAPTCTPLGALEAMVESEHRRQYAGEDVPAKAVTMLRIQAILRDFAAVHPIAARRLDALGTGD